MRLAVIDVGPLAQEADIWLRWLSVALVNARRYEDVAAVELLRDRLRERVALILGGSAW